MLYEVITVGKEHPAPLIAVDPEGGRVQRLTEPGFTRSPPARCDSTLCCHAERAAEATAEMIAEELRAVGVDINFAPVLDVDSNPENPVIGNRALSNDPSQVARLGISFFRGILSRGVIPVGKHFPGHGSTATDRITSYNVCYTKLLRVAVGLGTVSLSLLIGLLVGAASGFFGGKVDDVLMRLADVLLAFPGILLAIAITSVLGPSLRNVLIALCALGWVRNNFV